MSTLFISYSTKDRSIAELFYKKLIEMDYEPPFRDDHPESGIPAGTRWEDELYRKLRLCKALIVLCSQNWENSKWCFAELAYAKAMGKAYFPVVIDDAFEVPAVLGQHQAIRLSDQGVWDRLRRGLAEVVAPENDFDWPVSGHDACPYPGLESFEPHHAGIYFGREDEVQELREELNRMKDKRLLYVVGASGSGKSSLVKAGLLPRLTRKEHGQWCVLPTLRWDQFRRDRDWAEQLAIDLRNEWPTNDAKKPDRKTLRDRYLVPRHSKTQQDDEADGRYRATIVEAAANNFIEDTKDLLDARNQPDATPLLVIDQFEELLSDEHDKDATSFLEFLGGLMSIDHSPFRCIATVRTDFLTEIQTRPELIAWKDNTNVYSLPLMKPDKFHQVVQRPAEKVEIKFESDALVGRIVKDTGTNDALPLLAFALRELYDRFGDDKLFTFDEYNEQLGGLEGCLATVANEVIREPTESGELTTEEREKKLHLTFSNLVRINDQGQFVRRPAAWSELPREAHPLLERFIDRRLITSRQRDEGDLKSERVVEVAHEALFRRWDTLASWLQDNRDAIKAHNQFVAAVAEFQENKQSVDFLLQGGRLYQFVDLYNTRAVHGLRFSTEQRTFLNASIDAYKKEKNRKLEAARKLTAQQREIAKQQRARAEQQQQLAEEASLRVQAERRRVRQFKVAGLIVGLLAMLAGTAAGFWYFERGRAQTALVNETKALGKANDRLKDAKEAIGIASKIGESTEKFRSNEEARRDFEELNRILIVLEEADPTDSTVVDALGNVQLAIADLHREERQYQEAIDNYEKTEVTRLKIASQRPEFKRKYANVFMNRSLTRVSWAGEPTQPTDREQAKQLADKAKALVAEARDDVGQAQTIRNEIKAEIDNGGALDPDWEGRPLDGMIKLVRDLAKGYHALGNMDYEDDKYDAALGNFDEAFKFAKQVADADEDVESKRLLGIVLSRRGETQDFRKHPDLARSDITDAISILQPLAAENPDEDELQRDLSAAYRAMAYLEYGEGHFAEAVTFRKNQRDTSKRLVAWRNTNPSFRQDLLDAHRGLLYASYKAYAEHQVEEDESGQVEANILEYLASCTESLPKNRIRFWALKMSEFYADMDRDYGTKEGVTDSLTKRRDEFIQKLVELYPNDKFFQNLSKMPGVKIPATPS